MEKKNTLLLTVIAVATLLVAVVGATFAYFGSFDVQTTNKAGVNVTTEAAQASSFIVTSASIKLNVAGAEMLKGTSTEGVKVGTYDGKIENASLTATLKAEDPKTTTTCTYVIKYAYDSGSDIYGAGETPVTAGTTNEFPYKISLGEGTTGVTLTKTEGTFDEFKAATDEEKAITVGTATISASNTTTTQVVNFNVSFYNFPTIDQSALAAKSFAGKFYADTNQSNCSTTAN